jgi:putative hydrolase of the HAD superfamily
MYTLEMPRKIEGVAFDLDGTLYPNYRLYIRIIPFIFREYRLLWAMGKARDRLRAGAEGDGKGGGFYESQARIMAAVLGQAPATVKERTEKLIYRGWEPLFRKIRPYPHVRETLALLRREGLKLGLLSDFPPEIKLEYLGLGEQWDALLCSEATGRLKPDPVPFLALADALALPPEKILYVGNSIAYDILGAKRAGMPAALVSSGLCKKRRFTGGADFVFSDYRQLSAYVLR